MGKPFTFKKENNFGNGGGTLQRHIDLGKFSYHTSIYNVFLKLMGNASHWNMTTEKEKREGKEKKYRSNKPTEIKTQNIL